MTLKLRMPSRILAGFESRLSRRSLPARKITVRFSVAMLPCKSSAVTVMVTSLYFGAMDAWKSARCVARYLHLGLRSSGATKNEHERETPESKSGRCDLGIHVLRSHDSKLYVGLLTSRNICTLMRLPDLMRNH